MSEDDPIVGSVLKITAKIQCGGCGKPFEVSLDPGYTEPKDWSLFDDVVDTIRRGLNEAGMTSVQGGYLLCETCTRKIDAAVPEDRSATAAECARVFGEDQSL